MTEAETKDLNDIKTEVSKLEVAVGKIQTSLASLASSMENLDKEYKSILDRHSKILYGEASDLGIMAKVKYHDDYISEQKRSKIGITNIIYRAIIFAMVSFIMYKIGLAP